MVDTSTDAVAKLLDGVTPGPWVIDGISISHPTEPYGYPADVCLMGEPAQYPGDIPVMMHGWDANARFIAAARDLVPALLAERDALRAEVERLKAQSSPPAEPVAYCGRSSLDIVKSGNPAWMYPANAGDDLSGSVALYTAPQPITVHDAAKVPEVRALIERVERLFDVYDEAGRQLGKSERKLKDALMAITEDQE